MYLRQSQIPYVPVHIFSPLCCTVLYSSADRIKYLIELFRKIAMALVMRTTELLYVKEKKI